MLTILKGAVIVFAIAALFALIIFICAINAADLGDFPELSDEEIAEARSTYACYQEDDIES